MLLVDKLISKYKEVVFVDEPPGKLSCMSLEFSRNLQVDIYVSKYRYVKQFDINRGWTIDSL